MDYVERKLIKLIELGNSLWKIVSDPKGEGFLFYIVICGVGVFFLLMLALSYFVDGPSKKGTPKRVDPVIKEKMDRDKEEKTQTGTPKKTRNRARTADKLGSLETPDGRRVSLRNKDKKKKL